MQVPAIYILPDNSGTVPCLVRVHTKFDALGDVKGTSFAYAERHEDIPQIIFMRDQVLPDRGGIVSVEPGEAYCIDNTLPPDDITQTGQVTRLPDAEALGLPVPDCYDDSYTATFDPIMFTAKSSLAQFIEVDIPSLAGSPVELQGNDIYNIPLTSNGVLDDNRTGLIAAHDFFVGDQFIPYALDDQYFIRLDLAAQSLFASNTATFEINDGVNNVYEESIVVPRPSSGTTAPIAFFTRIKATQDMVDNGATFRVRFENDADLSDVKLYISL